MLRDEARAGRLDVDAVDAILAVAGHHAARRTVGPAGLTAREVEVLVLVARGCSTRQIARELGITPKTAGNHIEHIYGKAGITTRAAATMFAMRHGLLRSLDPVG
jgi:DNA-binding CsgD family transcriptional regulator